MDDYMGQGNDDDIIDAIVVDENGVPIDPDNGVVKTPEYAEVGFESKEEAELYGDTLIQLIMAGLELRKYVPTGRSVSEKDYTGKQKDLIKVYNASLQMRMLLDAMMRKAGAVSTVL
jgi:hypothetical protein